MRALVGVCWAYWDLKAQREPVSRRHTLPAQATCSPRPPSAVPRPLPPRTMQKQPKGSPVAPTRARRSKTACVVVRGPVGTPNHKREQPPRPDIDPGVGWVDPTSSMWWCPGFGGLLAPLLGAWEHAVFRPPPNATVEALTYPSGSAQGHRLDQRGYGVAFRNGGTTAAPK